MRKRVLQLVILLVAVVCSTFVASPVSAASFGDPHSCDSLAQHATYSYNNFTPSPFHAFQIPNSPTYSWGSDYLVACQEANPNDPGFNNANWDGYGNPFQCVELIDRYEYLRYHDSYSWSNAADDWSTHPGHYVQRSNGDVYVPAAGDILIWTNNYPGHIAIIIGVNAAIHQVTVLEQNFNYSGWHYGAKRVFYYQYIRSEPSAYISGSYTAYRQDGSTFTGTDADPVGWLHSTI